MGYRIDYAVIGRTMRARVSGRSSLGSAARIAADIAGEASRKPLKRLLLDVRGLSDRLGTLGPLVEGSCAPFAFGRVAVVDTPDNERFYAFPESAARSFGCELRCFFDSNSALRWLDACPS
jgi:hypothetical protein